MWVQQTGLSGRARCGDSSRPASAWSWRVSLGGGAVDPSWCLVLWRQCYSIGFWLGAGCYTRRISFQSGLERCSRHLRSLNHDAFAGARAGCNRVPPTLRIREQARRAHTHLSWSHVHEYSIVNPIGSPATVAALSALSEWLLGETREA
jgi:hypothetical protein